MANLITTAIIKAKLYGAEKLARVKLSTLEDISEAGLTTLSINDLLDEIAYRIEKALRVDWSGIMIFENRGGKSVIDYASRNFSHSVGQQTFGCCNVIDDVLADGEIRILKKGQLDWLKQYYGTRQLKTVAVVPVNLRQDRACIIALGKKASGPFTEDDIDLANTLACRAALALENALLFAQVERSYLEIVESLVKAIETKDKYTCGHSEQVATIAREIALAMGVDRESAERIYVAGLLHDVGKIGISSKILLKPSALSPEEFAEVKLHPIKGYEILKPIRGLEDLADITLQHHERFDGTGYPFRLNGDNIRVEARILAVADAFQAMVSNRPYRDGLDIDVVINEIKKGMGTQFDPVIVETFLGVLETGLAQELFGHSRSIAKEHELFTMMSTGTC